jgi:superfamily II DNA or RNA helicase
MNNKFLDSHINAFSTATVRLTGSKLLKENKVNFIDKLEGEKYSFTIEGHDGFLNKVSLTKPYSPLIESTCDCAYAEDGHMCEHQIAALSYLKQEENSPIVKMENQPKKKAKKGHRFSSEDLLLKDFMPISDSLIEKHKPDSFVDFTSFDYSCKEYKDTHITYDIVDNTDYSYHKDHNIVKITSKNSKTLMVRCTCSKLMKDHQLCEHAHALFQYLKKEKEDDFFTYLGKKGKDNLYKKASKEQKVSREVLDEFFDVSIEEGTLIVNKKKGNEGLIFENEWEEGLGEILISTITNYSSPEKHLPGLMVNDNYGFSIAIQLNKWTDVNICAVVAKKSKNKASLISEFKIYDSYEMDPFPYEFSKSYPEIFKLLEVFKSNTDLKFKKQINNNDLFIMLKKSFELSKELKYPLYYYKQSSTAKTSKKDLRPIELSEERVIVKFKVYKENLIYVLRLFIHVEGEEILIEDSNIKLLYINRFFIKHNDKLYMFKNIKHQKILESFREMTTIMVPHNDYNILESNFLRPLMNDFEIDLSEVKEIKKIDEYLRPISKELFLKESNGRVMFIPRLTYKNGAQFDLLSDTHISNVGKEIVKLDRDAEFEDNYMNFLEGLHKDFNAQRDLGVYFLDIKQMTSNYWFLDAFEQMRDHNIKIYGLNELKAFVYSTHKASVSTSFKSYEDWFDVDIQVSFGNYTLSIPELRKMAKNNDRFVELGDGSVGVLPKEWLGKLQKMFRYSDPRDKNSLHISKLKISLIDELFEDINQADILEELAEKRKRILSFNEIKSIEVPKQINAELRSYQKEGLNWLNFLDENQWGGILADDMGLGKTLQILSFMQAQINENPEKTHLVVLPTTLVFNWKKEIEKFTQGINTHFHVGFKRMKNTRKFEDANLVVTTYGVLLNDIEFIKDFRFKYAILDESQMIKNPNSKRYKAAILINAENKIAMTGTPIENNTFDLYAQMNFVNPGFLGSQKAFKEDYSLPIDRDRNEKRAKDLHKLINPFILRRTKTQVATELPPKIEDVLYCEMESEQQKVYEAFRNKYRDYLMGKIEENGLNKSKMYVLEGLVKLRQICDSPRLLTDDEVYTNESIKIKTLLSHIEEKTNNHKILVFSQFVKMLELVKEELEYKNISYEYLDGKCSGKQREKSVDNFQNNDNVRVFLISLKAGGTGLNLTAADYIYILDPWWNPAVENQAIDRAYRIGQDKKVIAYRMIAKNTIEEKIMTIQAKKKKLAGDIIQTDESILKELTQADVLDLFQ